MSFKNKLRCVVWRRMNKKIAATTAQANEKDFQQARRVQNSTFREYFLLGDTGRCSASKRYFFIECFWESSFNNDNIVNNTVEQRLRSRLRCWKVQRTPNRLRSIIQHCSFYGRFLDHKNKQERQKFVFSRAKRQRRVAYSIKLPPCMTK